MKKLFTLSIAIFCALTINAQMSESGNGFAETFTYDDGTIYDDVPYEGIGAEWGDFSVIEDGKLKWDLEDAGETAIGLWELNMDLTGNTDITFQYQFPLGAEFGIWIENNAGEGGELFPEDLLLGLSEMMEYTLDAADIKVDGTEDPLDLTDIAEIWIMSFTETAGTFYLDSLVIGDGSLTETGISSKLYKSGLQVYPNPATDEFRIDADIKSLSVYNSIGQMVQSVEDYQNGSSVDVSDLRKGLYIIKADDSTHKLMVE